MVRRVVRGLSRRWKRCFGLRRDWRKIAAQSPQVLKVELTNICNANCIFCGYQYQKRKKGLMDEQTYLKALNDSAAIGTRAISFVPIVGEPLVAKEFIARVRQAREWGFSRVYTYTNGIWIKRRGAGSLLGSGLTELAISVPPLEQTHFEQLFRSNEYGELVSGLEEILSLNEKQHWPVKISLRFRSHLPESEVLNLPDYVNRIKPYLRNGIFDVGVLTDFDDWGGVITERDLVGEMRFSEMKQDRSRPCRNLFNLTVLWNGLIHACGCRFPDSGANSALMLGNIHDISLREAWHSGELRDLRESFPKGCLCDECQNCRSYNPI